MKASVNAHSLLKTGVMFKKLCSGRLGISIAFSVVQPAKKGMKIDARTSGTGVGIEQRPVQCAFTPATEPYSSARCNHQLQYNVLFWLTSVAYVGLPHLGRFSAHL